MKRCGSGEYAISILTTTLLAMSSAKDSFNTSGKARIV